MINDSVHKHSVRCIIFIFLSIGHLIFSVLQQLFEDHGLILKSKILFLAVNSMFFIIKLLFFVV